MLPPLLEAGYATRFCVGLRAGNRIHSSSRHIQRPGPARLLHCHSVAKDQAIRDPGGAEARHARARHVRRTNQVSARGGAKRRSGGPGQVPRANASRPIRTASAEWRLRTIGPSLLPIKVQAWPGGKQAPKGDLTSNQLKALRALAKGSKTREQLRK